MERELAYLNELCSKYGTHYLKKYFGFTLRDIAEKMHIAEQHLSLMRKKGLSKKYKDKFIDVFKEMDIEGRTRGFKESNSDLKNKEVWQKVKRLENGP